jgi:predicted 3-demethylubiquinone-9 3-methyltransferase (glyoxalase superfamily)
MKSGITTHLWFESGAEDAAKYYNEVFNDSKIITTTLYPKAAEAVSGKPAGSVMTVEIEINGSRFVLLNGGKVPGFDLNSSVSFMVSCDTQEEIDHLWEKLSAVPEAEQCGWCKDKFGVTWQIVPGVLEQMLSDEDPTKVENVTRSFLAMKKFDIAELEKAFSR